MSDTSDTLWNQQQDNYFFGEAEARLIDASGRIYQRRWPLGTTDPPPAWQPAGRLEADTLNQLQALLQTFMSFEPVMPPYVIPDNFPWRCVACLNGNRHDLAIYANSPAEQRACFEAIANLLKADQSLG